MKEDVMVSRPAHYQSQSGLETIEVIEAFTAELQGIEAVDTANIIKYICRWKKKNGIQDLQKAGWYLNHLIEHLENKASLVTNVNVVIKDTRVTEQTMNDVLPV